MKPLAIKPLAVLIRADREVRGIKVGTIEEKFSLYVDDALLYLADTSASLRKAVSLFDQFSEFSRIRINWDKSVLFSLHSLPNYPNTQMQLQWVEDMKYLGIKVTNAITDYATTIYSP